MPIQKITLASGDGHVGAPIELYRDYLPRQMRPAFDEYLADHVSRWSPSQKKSYFPRTYNSKFWPTEGYDPDHGTAIAWDATLRLKALDQSMIACEVLIPDDTNTNDPPFGAGLATAMTEHGSVSFPPEHVRAGARAYNRWLTDFSSADRDRFKGLITLGTAEDVTWCVEEIQQAFESGLTAGLLLPLDYYQPMFHHPRYDPIWQLCSELNIPVVSHIGRGHPTYLGEDPWVQRFMFGVELMTHAQRPVWCLIMGGVLERFPDLRLVVAEAGVNWVNPLLQGLDASFTMWPEIQASRDVPGRVNLTMKPSEYWRRQCYVVHSASQTRAEFEGAAFDNVPNMVFGSDLGHQEGWWPVFGYPDPKPKGQPKAFEDLPLVSVDKAPKELWGGLSAQNLMPFLQDTFFEAFPSFDRAGLQDVTERVGPTLDDIGLI
jgi:predicted TIM-barrel fold metal-dependent hydrolase